MKRQLIFGVVTLALVVNFIVGARIYTASAATTPKDSAYSNLELYTVVLDRVRKEYVDGTNLTYQKLVYSSLKGMVNSLDPHSEFLDPEEYKELQSDTEGNFGGLGIVVGMRDNWVTVIEPMDDSPGFKAGILPGDRIVKIEGKSTESVGLPDAVKELRGEPGTSVSLTIFRPSTKATNDYTLTRAIINVDTVKDINNKKEFPLGPDKVGYIHILQFGDKTSDELESALKKLKSQGMEGLVLDLRWNPGGLLDQAVEVCSKFLARGQPVVSTEGRNLADNYSRHADGHDELKGAPIVIIANIGSASAAEIVTGCLQDLHRAVVLGEKTFGKGSVQSVINLDDGSALKLTTAKYYTPSHKVIHEHGITPDTVVPLSDQQEHDISIRRMPGALDSLSADERAKVLADRDTQLDRATDLIKALLIYNKRASGS